MYEKKTKAEIRAKFEGQEYPIHVVGRHIDITEPMKAYAVEKLRRIDRFEERVIDAMIVMDIQKLVHSVDFLVNLNNTRIKVSGRSENMYASIDQAIQHLNYKLSRYTRKLHEHNARPTKEIDMNVNVIQRITPVEDINDQIEEETLRQVEEELRPHRIVSRETKPLKLLNQDEAIMKMELSEDLFMVYLSEEEGRKLKLIYRRDDGNYGIIDLPDLRSNP